ncbi:MAG: glycosyltransferase [Bowdeniella nasicola]|nr:glycosyltransferase [Bowdeniella nasicola]
MRILEIAGLSAGGVRSHLADVCAALRGHECAVLAPAPVLTYLAERGQRPSRSAAISLGALPSSRDLLTLRTIRAWARRADVVHAHTLRAGAYAALALAGLRRRPRLVVTAHNMPLGSALVRATGAVLFAIVARGADRILGVSPDLVERARRLGADAGLAIVPAPPTTLPARPLTDEPGARPTIAADLPRWRQGANLLTVGRLSYQKGLDLLMDTAERLAPDHDLTWYVAGEGPEQATLAEQIEQRALPVVLLGRRTDIPDLLRGVDVVVQTSRWEGQPVALQEAIHAGAAIVATDVGGSGVVLGPELAGCTPQPQSLAAEIEALLRDPDALRARRAAARERSATLPDTADLARHLAVELHLDAPEIRDVPGGGTSAR